MPKPRMSESFTRNSKKFVHHLSNFMNCDIIWRKIILFLTLKFCHTHRNLRSTVWCSSTPRVQKRNIHKVSSFKKTWQWNKLTNRIFSLPLPLYLSEHTHTHTNSLFLFSFSLTHTLCLDQFPKLWYFHTIIQ